MNITCIYTSNDAASRYSKFSPVYLQPEAVGVDWPQVHHLDTFASCFNDALALRI